MSQSGHSFRSIVGLPPSTATTSDSVYIIIDAQNEYDYGLLNIANLEQSQPNVLTVLNKYRAMKGDVIHVLHQGNPQSPIMTGGTDLEKVFPELEPIDGEYVCDAPCRIIEVVNKPKVSAFADTNLHELLQNLGKKKIVLAGYQAHMCVSNTARAGHELGYDVLIVGDAVGDRDVPGAKAAELVKIVLAELGDGFATIIQSSDL